MTDREREERDARLFAEMAEMVDSTVDVLEQTHTKMTREQQQQARDAVRKARG